MHPACFSACTCTVSRAMSIDAYYVVGKPACLIRGWPYTSFGVFVCGRCAASNVHYVRRFARAIDLMAWGVPPTDQLAKLPVQAGDAHKPTPAAMLPSKASCCARRPTPLLWPIKGDAEVLSSTTHHPAARSAYSLAYSRFALPRVYRIRPYARAGLDRRRRTR